MIIQEMTNNKKRILFCIFIIEIFIFVIMARRLFKEPISVSYFGSEINTNEQIKGVETSEGGLVFDGESSGSVCLGNTIELNSYSAYEVFVEYETSYIRDGVYPSDIAFNMANASFNSIDQDKLYLYSGSNHTYGRIYTEGTASGNIVLSYNEGAPVIIKSVVLSERRIWQLFKLILVFLVFVIVDAVVLFLPVIRKRISKMSVALLGITLVALLPCFVNFIFGGHDLPFHLYRTSLLAAELKDGNIPCRLYSYIYDGYGYANPIYYGDLFLGVPAVLYNLMVPLYACIQVYIGMLTIITIINSYFLFNEICDNKQLVLTGIILFVFSPYRLSCIWVRSALGEYTALAFLPLVFLGMYIIYRSKRLNIKGAIILGGGMSLTFVTHILSVELLIVPLCLFVILLWKDTIAKHRIYSLLIAVGIFILLSMWFIIPIIHTSTALNIRAFNSEIREDIQDTGLYFLQLLNPFFTSNGANVFDGMIGEMPLSLGISGIMTLAVWSYLAVDKIENGYAVSKISKYVFLIGILVTLFTTIYFPWRAISRYGGFIIAKLVNECQFSWRYLGIATLLMTIALCLGISEIIRRKKGCLGREIIIVSCIITLICAGDFYRSYINEWTEYPKGSQWTIEGDLNQTFFSIDADNTGKGGEEADLVLINKKVYYKNETGLEQNLSVPVYAFLNVKARDVASKRLFDVSMNEKGLLVVKIPTEYDGTIEIIQKEPILWRIGEIISVFVAVGIVILWIIVNKKEGNKE